MNLYTNKKKIIVLILYMLPISCSVPNYNRKIDHLFRDYIGYNKPGAAIMVIKGGKQIFKRTYGMANIENSIFVACNTNFRLASLSKQFTAMAIMILIERGELNYNTKLSDIFKEFPSYGKDVTVLHLLRHTSGLIDYSEFIDSSTKKQLCDEDVFKMMMNVDSTYFIPGTRYRYSNSGYAVLAIIVEKISDKAFETFLDENIFQPLEMYNTVAFKNGCNKVPFRAYGYNVCNDSVILSDQSTSSAILGDGGIYSSIEDLYRWDQALYTNKLVSKETLELALIPGIEDYGFGLRIDKFRGHTRIYHAGVTCGFRSFMQRFPEKKLTIIILTNRNGPRVDRVAEILADLYI